MFIRQQAFALFCCLAAMALACGGRSDLYAPYGARETDQGAGGSAGQEAYVSLRVEMDPETPKTQIVVAGHDDWVVFTQYVLTNESSVPVEIEEVVVGQRDSNGDTADFTAVALATDDKVVRFQTPVPASADEDQNWPLSEKVVPLIIEPETALSVKLMTKLAPVMPGSVDTPPWHGVARSGHTPSLQLIGINASHQGQEFAAEIEQHAAPFMVVRKTKLAVTSEPLTNETLTDGVMELVRFRVSVDPAGPISLLQLAFGYTKTPGLQITNLHLRKNGEAISTSSYHPVFEKGVDKVPEYLTEDALWFVFIQEQFLTSDSTLSIHGAVKNAAPGQNIGFFFRRNTEKTEPVTGYLTMEGNVIGIAQKGIVPGAQDPMSPLPGYPAYLLWSDCADGSHGPGTGDWTTDLYVQSLDWQQTLSL